MLIDFTMKNFKSFKDETTLSLETGERLSKFRESNTISVGKISLLKNLLIFGPNGSGKSNLLDGLKLMQEPSYPLHYKLLYRGFLYQQFLQYLAVLIFHFYFEVH